MKSPKWKMSSSALFFAFLLAGSPMVGAAAQENENAEEPPTTGFEDSDGEEWTSHDDELQFLEEVAEQSEWMTYYEIGTSVEDRPLHLVQVGAPEPPADEDIADGNNMLVIGSQHGNEPAGREMALQTLRDLAFTDDTELEEQLNESTVMFIPSANPDGRVADTRTNANDVDINRDHLNLEEPEGQAIGEVLEEFSPDITIDAHERPTATGDPDMEMLWPRNLNVDEDLRDLNQEMVEEYLFPDVEDAGFSTGLYGTPGGAGGGDERISRNVLGLRHGLGLLTETAGEQDPQYRVDAQVETVESVLNFYSERMDDISTEVNEAPDRKAVAGEEQSEPFYLDGADNWEPTETLDPHACGYMLHTTQAEDIDRHIDAFSLETEEVSEHGVFATMGQSMMTVIPFLMDGEATYNEVSAMPLEGCEDPRVTASGLQSLVGQFDEDGEFEGDDAPHDLDIHLEAVSHYENQEETEKVVEHMGGFHDLLGHQSDNELISDEAFEILSDFADDLIANYETTFDADRVMDHVEHLSVDIGPRVAGTDEEAEAADYIYDEFESLGYETSTHEFEIADGDESQNVIAVREAEGVEDPEIVYLTAHYDSVPESPGANDNASGTASLLEHARVMQDMPTDKEIRFVALGAEEIGLVGSDEYVDELSEDEIDRSEATYNLDMVGTDWDPASQLHISTVDGESNTVWETADAAAENVGFDEDEWTLHQLGRSDHVPFHEAGIDAALFIWMEPDTEPGGADLEPWYHTPEDTIDKVSPEKIQQVGDLIDEAVSDLVSEGELSSTDEAA
ncbi:M28 family peptidase [Natribacillus halophilus]|uniref:Zinc carboxypeptidase n=1 Tax=Natribacillus halophilus TaxID=549003 RepID=A0A1G8MTU0_9BACI|nr:M28 family peptidase [Natribacillus halophilus]SDI71458.1 Zinc carboxypeptidase [Natribacillus halophilus]